MSFGSKNPLFDLVPAMYTVRGQLALEIQAMANAAHEDVDTVRGSMFVVLVTNKLDSDAATSILNDVFGDNAQLRAFRDQPITAYPQSAAKSLWVILRLATIRWIDTQCPGNFARARFAVMTLDEELALVKANMVSH